LGSSTEGWGRWHAATSEGRSSVFK
jgi:hypothetical protein